ncbi:MAG: dephospho-CoA kinase [Balneolaceae bacterium]
MIKVGVTGGIGSGKSTLCKEWEKLGAYVVYADDLAKELMITNERVKNKIINEFGGAAYDSDGNLNRQFLSKKAFQENKVAALNQIVHPAVYKETERLAGYAENKGYKVFVKEAALLLQNGRPEMLDIIVIVKSKEENRIQRVISRDGTDKNKVQARINKQQNFESLEYLADYVIENDGSLFEFKKKAESLYRKILESNNM